MKHRPRPIPGRIGRGGEMCGFEETEKMKILLTICVFVGLALPCTAETIIVDPNDVKAILALEGVSPSKLIKIELDETYLALKANTARAAALKRQQQQYQYQEKQQLQQIQKQLANIATLRNSCSSCGV